MAQLNSFANCKTGGIPNVSCMPSTLPTSISGMRGVCCLFTWILHLQNIEPNARPADTCLQEPALPLCASCSRHKAPAYFQGAESSRQLESQLRRLGSRLLQVRASLASDITEPGPVLSPCPGDVGQSLSHHTKPLRAGNTLVPNLDVVLRCLLPEVASFILDLGLGCTQSLTLSLTEELGQMSKKMPLAEASLAQW